MLADANFELIPISPDRCNDAVPFPKKGRDSFLVNKLETMRTDSQSASDIRSASINHIAKARGLTNSNIESGRILTPFL